MKETRNESLSLRLIRDTIKKDPDRPARTIARQLYGKHPELWRTLEHCRSAVRYALGLNGKENRGLKVVQKYSRERRNSGDDWTKYLPPARSHFEEWGPVQYDGPFRALVLSDIHVPYHDAEALGVAIQYGIDRDANFILINGDGCDFFAVSDWVKDPRERDFPGEIRAMRGMLRALREAFPKARMIFKEGNHEERYERYLRMKAPELLGIEEVEWPKLVGMDEMKCEFVGEKRPIRLGELNVIHGHEYRFGIVNPVNPARGFFLRAKTHVLGGHLHQTSQHSEKDLEGKIVSTWSTGCLCNLHPDYRPINQWNHGFAFVVVDKDGAFDVENLRIIGGRAW